MATGSKRKARAKQGELEFRSWGGARKGAGRKPGDGVQAKVSHAERERLDGRCPVHVTTKLQKGLPGLRSKATYAVLREQFAKGCARFGFRLVHYSVQGDHLHMVCEAKDRRALSRGMQGLCVRIARALNRAWGRTGRVFADHYHAVVLRTPRQVRAALAYVLHNAKKHAAERVRPTRGSATRGAPTRGSVRSPGRRLKAAERRSAAGLQIAGVASGLDYFSSGCWFDGWKERFTVVDEPQREAPTAAARTWLLKVGWRRCRLVSLGDVPG